MKKLLFLFGYGRWDKIREASQDQSGSLVSKTDTELRIYSNSFINQILGYVTFEKSDLKKFLLNLMVAMPNDPVLNMSQLDWGDLIN